MILQKLWKELEKKDAQECADIGAPDKMSQDQSLGWVAARLVWRTLKKQVRSHPTLNFNDIELEAVAREQGDAKATMVLTKKSKPLFPIEETLASSLI